MLEVNTGANVPQERARSPPSGLILRKIILSTAIRSGSCAWRLASCEGLGYSDSSAAQQHRRQVSRDCSQSHCHCDAEGLTSISRSGESEISCSKTEMNDYSFQAASKALGAGGNLGQQTTNHELLLPHVTIIRLRVRRVMFPSFTSLRKWSSRVLMVVQVSSNVRRTTGTTPILSGADMQPYRVPKRTPQPTKFVSGFN